ncbi:hypothetical protein [Planobispora rosea]|uniref:hypothetical protein n=1 Tax=Planobispora rosea TaxID=35762 RepID=UPI00083A32A8|nr:hypothetical protein [Planobispora rosea]
MLEIPDFDPKKMRSAIRRGYFRVALVLLLVASSGIVSSYLATGLLQRRHPLTDSLLIVIEGSLRMSDPAFEVSYRDSRRGSLTTTYLYDRRPLRAAGTFVEEAADQVEVDVGLFGDIESPPRLPYIRSRLADVLEKLGTGKPTKASAEAALSILPEDMTALAVVEFAQPLTADQARAFVEEHNALPTRVVYGVQQGSAPIVSGPEMFPDLKAVLTNTGKPGTTVERVVTGPVCLAEGLAELRRWVGTLGDDDASTLAVFNLDLPRLKQAASQGLAYAYIDEVQTVKELRTLLKDPQVRSVQVADLAYNLDIEVVDP